MKVFVAGAAGVIGRRLVPMLVRDGHEVVGTTRKPDRAEWLRAEGATPVGVDLLDREATRAAVAEASPQVVVHQLTDIPIDLDLRRYEEQMAGNDRIRREATPILVEAAVAAGARRVVAQSISFAYAPTGDRVKDEEDPLFDDAPAAFRHSVEALRTLERSVTGTPGIEGVVLRYGYFYGPGTTYARDGGIAARTMARQMPVVGDGGGVFSFVHVDDAAEATVAALDRGGPGIYNVVDDEPAPAREWLPVYAAALGAKRPWRVPRWLARRVAGDFAAFMATEQRGASNAKARRELGWEPRHPTWRTGFAESLAAEAPGD